MAYNAYPYQVLIAQKGNYANERVTGVFYLNRTYRWKKDGSYIASAVGPSYLVAPSDVGSAITCEEAVWRAVEPSNGSTPQNSSNITYTESPPINVIAGGSPLRGVLYPQNITYVGTFGLPSASNDPSPPKYATFAFGLFAAGIGAVGGTKTLMLAGHNYEVRMGHVTIPSDSQLVNAFTVPVASLNRTVSSLLSPATHIALAFEGRLDPAGPTSDGNGYGSGTTGSPNRGIQRVGTTDKVLLTGLHTYSLNHHGFIWRRPMDFSVTGQIEGPVAPVEIGVMENSRAVAGYMCSVAPENRAALKGDILIGVTGLSVVSATSDGPSLMSLDSSTFDAAFAKRVNGTVQAGSTALTVKLDSSASSTPSHYVGWYIHIPDFNHVASKIKSYDEVSKTVTVTSWDLVNGGVTVPPTGATYKLIPQLNGKALCVYGLDELAILRHDELSPVWAYNNTPVGVFQPSGSKAVLWVGNSGQGMWTYNANGELTGPDEYQGSYTYDGPKIYDPEGLARGPHQYPETIRVWAYSVDDLALVASGSKTYSQVKPYAIWSMNIPYGQRVRSVTYDDSTKRLYLIQNNEGVSGAGEGVVHVYQVAV